MPEVTPQYVLHILHCCIQVAACLYSASSPSALENTWDLYTGIAWRLYISGYMPIFFMWCSDILKCLNFSLVKLRFFLCICWLNDIVMSKTGSLISRPGDWKFRRTCLLQRKVKLLCRLSNLILYSTRDECLIWFSQQVQWNTKLVFKIKRKMLLFQKKNVFVALKKAALMTVS